MPRKYTITPVADRFWPKVNKTETCWLWTGKSRTAFGYGLINMGGKYGKIERAHRVSWLIHFGPIPAGLFVCHHCDTPLCVRPDHLFLGTPADNNRDMSRKNRYDRMHRPKGEAHGCAKLTAIQVKAIRAVLEQGHTLTEIARQYNVSITAIYSIAHRRTWKHI